MLVLTLLLVEITLCQVPISVISHQFEPADITVGDEVLLWLQIEAAEALRIYLEPIDVSDLRHVEIDKPRVERIRPEKTVAGSVLYRVLYPLRAFSPGKHTLPPITIKYTSDVTDGAIQTPPYAFEVRSVKPADATEIKAIKSPFAPSQRLLPYIVSAVLVVAVVGTLAFLYFRKRAKPADVLSEVLPHQTPHEIAHAQLNQIEALDLVAKGEMKVYHTKISLVIRQYIAARYTVPALELTSEDLLTHLIREDIGEDNICLIRAFFAHCNVVKFAKHRPTKPEAHERMAEARQIVDNTKLFGDGKHNPEAENIEEA